MRFIKSIFSAIFIFVAWLSVPAAAQQETLRFSTVDRAPFSTNSDEGYVGFSIELMQAIAQKLGRDVTFETAETFTEMLGLVEAEEKDGAIANISITSAREEVIDFSQPIFESGLKILVPAQKSRSSIFATLFTQDILFAALFALGMLFVAGIVMWMFERNRQPYFDRSIDKALFPSFWWALNLVVNGGFEERMPQSPVGRLFATAMVVSSLFLVSVFVAHVTAAVTIDALQDNVSNLNDLDGQRVGTVANSTAANLLDARDIGYIGFNNPAEMIASFEDGRLDALFFDAPILAFAAAQMPDEMARLLDRNYRPENYGIALPEGSSLREPINRALLGLREDGSYDQLVERWFGQDYRP